MKKVAMMPIIIFIVLSFFSLSFAEQKVQIKPGVVQTKPVQVTPMEFPDLVMDSIWLDNQCNINFKLRNTGKGNIPDAEHRESVVRFSLDQRSKISLLEGSILMGL